MRFHLLFSLCLLSAGLFGQTEATLDSLRGELEQLAPGDTLRFPVLNDLYHLAAYGQPRLAQRYARLIRQEGIVRDYPLMVGEGLLRLGITHEELSNFDSAVYYYDQAYTIYQQDDHAAAQAAVLYNSSIVFQRQGLYPEARRRLLTADSIYTVMGDSLGRSTVFNVLAQVERESGNFEAGLKNALFSAELVRNSGDSSALIEAEQEIGVHYKLLENFPEAIKYLRRQVSFYERRNDVSFAANSLSILAGAYAGAGEVERAIESAHRALGMLPDSGLEAVELSVRNALGGFYELANDNQAAEREYLGALRLVNAENDERRTAMLLTELSEVQLKLGKNTLAQRNAQRAVALAEKLGIREYEFDARGYLATSLARRGSYREAFGQLERRQALQDSLYQVELADKLVELTTLYEKEKQDRLIGEQRSRLRLLESQAKIDRWQKTALALGLSGLLLVLAGLWYAFRQRHLRQRAEQARLQEKVRGQQQELSVHAVSMARKGALLDQLGEQLSQIKSQDPRNQKQLDSLLRTMSSEERIDQDWANFQTYFAGVHAGFEDRLRAAAGNDTISIRESRLAALIRMQLNNQEIGTILSISQESLYKAKYRLRKKLPDVNQGELDVFLREL